MVPVPWNSNYQATIEFCQDLTNSSIYGYRLPGEDSCHLAALMIRVVPGNQYRLTIRNRSNRTTTNLHTHGLHISGNGNSDNPMRVVSPYSCITYHWDIPANHMGGTHWMHSHDMEHGYEQVRGGALAMFVVEENPALLDNVDAASKLGIAAWLRNELLLVASKTLVGHRGSGLVNAQYNLTVNEWYRLRILGAEVDGNEFLLRLPAPCTIYTVAHDGVWRFSVPNLASSPADAEYRMTPAGRLDLAIKCPRSGSFAITAVSTVIPNSVIATLNVRSGTPSIATPFTSTGFTWAPNRPSYLQDLLQPSVVVDNLYNISIFSSSINGNKFQMGDPPLDTITYGSVQEWTVRNAAKPHSYHQHIHHFQVVSCAGHDSGEFYDTILPVDNANPCVLRIRVSDYSGNWFLHCHTIVHSEMGAMAMFHVTDGGIVNDNQDYDEFVC
jgi:FtsP/CotA-like multicopper oxidase with cupredoxin domain